jgi:hypothetical protein
MHTPFIIRAGVTHTSNGITITATTSTRSTITGLPAAPSGLVMFSVCAGALSGPDTGQHQSSCLGVCDFNGASNAPQQVCFASSSNDAGATIPAGHIACADPSPTDGAIAAWDYGATTTDRAQAKIVARTSDGFTIDWYNNAGSSVLAPVEEFALLCFPTFFETARIVTFDGFASSGTYNASASLPEANRGGIFGLFDSSLNAWDGDAPFSLGLVLGTTFQRSINIQCNSGFDDFSVQFLTAFGSGEIRDTGTQNSRTVDISISSTQVTAVNTQSSTVRAPGAIGLVWSTDESLDAVDFDTPTSTGAANFATGLGYTPDWHIGVLTKRTGNDAAPVLTDALYGLFGNGPDGGAAATFGLAGSGSGAPSHRTYVREGGAALTTGSAGQLLEADAGTFGSGVTGLNWTTVDASAYKGFALVGTSPVGAAPDPVGDATIANTIDDMAVYGTITQSGGGPPDVTGSAPIVAMRRRSRR